MILWFLRGWLCCLPVTSQQIFGWISQFQSPGTDIPTCRDMGWGCGGGRIPRVAGRTGDLHPGNASLGCFASAAQHVRKLSTLMPLLEERFYRFLFVSIVVSFSTQLEPWGLLPCPYCEPLKQTLFCPAATSDWAKCCPTKHLLSVQRLPPPACTSVIFFRQSVSINLIVITPKAIFSSPLELKG